MERQALCGIVVPCWPVLVKTKTCGILLLFSLISARQFTTVDNEVSIDTALRECDRQGKPFCDFPVTTSHRAEINAAVERSPIRVRQQFLNWNENQVREEEFKTGVRDIIRRKRLAARIDCTAICCAKIQLSEPKGYFKDKNGWQQIASTPEFPQRIQIETTTCQNTNAPCRGVNAQIAGFRAGCVQVLRKHVILLYRPNTKEIVSTTIQLPGGCNCALQRNPFALRRTTTQKPRRTRQPVFAAPYDYDYGDDGDGE